MESVKDIIWDKAAKKTVRSFTVEVRQEIGALLMALQRGLILGMPQARAIRTVHQNAFELRVKDKNGITGCFT